MTAVRVQTGLPRDRLLGRTPFAPGRPRILLIDDDRSLLNGLRRRLHGSFDVNCAEAGETALQLVAQSEAFAVVVSDMRMPGMDGVAVLKRLQKESPDTVRVLLTGYVDVENAIAAVNEGNIFRFLCKPVDQNLLEKVLEDAISQYQLVTAERELLEKTLQGSVRALSEVLSLANPAAFSRGLRLRALVTEIVERLGMSDCWEIEMASTLSQLGAVTLPEQVIEKLNGRAALDAAEAAMVERLPEIANHLLEEIPRLEGVRRIIGDQRGCWRPTEVSLGGAILRIATDWDALETAGVAPGAIRATLKERYGNTGRDIVEALLKHWDNDQVEETVVERDVGDLVPGMILESEIRTSEGRLVVGRGQVVTPGLLERLANFSARHTVSQTVLVTRSTG